MQKSQKTIILHEKDCGIFRLGETLSSCLSCSPLLFPCHFSWFTKDFRTLNRGFSIIIGASYIPLKDLWTKLCDIHLSGCEKFAHKIPSDPFHPLNNDLAKCHSHTSTRSNFRSTPFRINIHRNSAVTYLAREQMMNDIMHNLW